MPPAEFCGVEFSARTAMALTMEMLQLFGLVLGQIPKRRVPSVDLPLPVTLLLFFFPFVLSHGERSRVEWK